MATILPNIFSTGGGNLTFNVDFFDYFANAGYKRFYPTVFTDSVSSKYILSPEKLDSFQGQYRSSASNSTSEINFDLTFANPATLATSKVYINYTVVTDQVGHAHFTIYHVDAAAAETSLGTVESRAHPAGNTREGVVISITGANFAVGETLRLEVLFTDGDANGNPSYIYHDPNSLLTLVETTSARTIKTDMTVDVPFLMDI
jgi:hypothetical protein